MIGDHLHQQVHGSPQEADLEQLVELILMKMRNDPSSVTQEELQILKSQGRDGDRELANIGPETAQLFDHMAGHRTQNPKTGLHEYWSLGGVLGGLWDSIKGGASQAWGAVKEHAPGIMNSAAQAILPHAGKMASEAINSKFGADSPWAGALNSLAGMGQNMASQGINHLAGGKTSEYGKNAGDAFGGALGGLARGESAGKAFGEGLEKWGNTQGGLAGDFAKNTGKNLVKGDSFGTSLVDSAKQIAGWGQNGGFAKGFDARQMGPAMLQGGMQGLNKYLSGGTWKQALGEGVQGAARGFGQNGMGNAVDQFGRGLQQGGFRQGAMNAGNSAFEHLAPRLHGAHSGQHYGMNRMLADQQNAQAYGFA
jgi:hypothetical protein